ncbi:hypothetical protein H0H93_008006, partial [Arthromyces matolae]
MAISGLKIYDGYLCIKCPYACLQRASLLTHFTNQHKDLSVLPKERYTRGPIQTFFNPIPIRYFRVELPALATKSVFDVFMLEEEPKLNAGLIQPPQHAREVTPLLTCTHWHIHLEGFLASRNAREELHTLVQPPNISDAKPWAAHKSDDTLKEYGRVLYNLASSTMTAYQGHESGYTFPLTREMQSAGSNLSNALNASNTDDLNAYHRWVYPFLSHDSGPKESNKWSMVIECWLAIYHMNPEGHWASPTDITPVLAKLKYIMRGSTLFEAYRIVGGNLEQLHQTLEALCLQNLSPGSFTPFNTVSEYQRFISALALNQPGAPSCSMSADASKVSYKDKTLDLTTWKMGMRGMYKEAHDIISELCLGASFSVDLPASLVDDMSNTVYGYSWLELAKEFVDPNALIHHLMSSPDSSPCMLDASQKIVWNHQYTRAFLIKSARLVNLLAMLHHIVPGQPSRIAELCDFKIRNGMRGRNIFISHGEDWLITRRVKSETLMNGE